MSLIIPNTFATKTGAIQLSLLDENFTEVSNSVNTLITDVPIQINGLLNAPTFNTSVTVNAATNSRLNISSSTASSPSYLQLNNSTDNSNSYIYANGLELRISQSNTSANSVVTLFTQNTERVRVHASGGLSLGNVSDPGQSNFSTSGYVAARLRTGYYGQLMAVAGTGSTWYNAFLRNDGTAVYLLSSAAQPTADLAINAIWSSFRPFSWDLVSGTVAISKSGGTTNIGGHIVNKQVAKAWAYVVSGVIVSSYNITSVSKPGTGRYLFTMTTNLADTNYTLNITGSAQVSVQHCNGYIDNNAMAGGTYVHSLTQFQIAFINSANSSNFADQTYLSVIVYGN